MPRGPSLQGGLHSETHVNTGRIVLKRPLITSGLRCLSLDNIVFPSAATESQRTSRWPPPSAVSKHRHGCNPVSFADIELKCDVIVAEAHVCMMISVSKTCIKVAESFQFEAFLGGVQVLLVNAGFPPVDLITPHTPKRLICKRALLSVNQNASCVFVNDWHDQRVC